MRKIRVILAIIFFLTFAGVASAQELMSLEEVEKLIDSSPNKEIPAYFKSVERGTEIKRYNIILKGVYREPGLTIILFVTHHKIAAGMSGSPVYVNGKKVGAVAYQVSNFNFS